MEHIKKIKKIKFQKSDVIDVAPANLGRIILCFPQKIVDKEIESTCLVDFLGDHAQKKNFIINFFLLVRPKIVPCIDIENFFADV